MIDQEPRKNIDNGMKPIYEDNYLLIQRPSEYAVPGMYTIEPQQHKETLGELNDTELALIAYVQRQLRFGLKSEFGVAICGLYVEAHTGERIASHTIPFHIDRLSEQFSVEVYQPHTLEYLRSYAFDSSRQQIGLIDDGIRDILNDPKVKEDIKRITTGGSLIVEPEVSEREAVRHDSVIEDIIEVFDESEVPGVPEGKKYFVCIGGSKNFQCFLSDKSMSKGEFLVSHEDEIDDCLRPIYEDNRIIVRQDSRYAIPGFYIISPKLHYRSIDEIPQDTYQECLFMARDISQGLSTLGIQRTHLYHDEKYRARMSAHFWVMPLYEDYADKNGLNLTIFSRDIWTYLDTFPRYEVTKPQILDFNSKMQSFLKLKRPHWA